MDGRTDIPDMLIRATNLPNSNEIPLSPCSSLALNAFFFVRLRLMVAPKPPKISPLLSSKPPPGMAAAAAAAVAAAFPFDARCPLLKAVTPWESFPCKVEEDALV